MLRTTRLSNKRYSSQSYILYTLEYTFTALGELKKGRLTVGAPSEEDALEQANKTILVSSYPDFNIRIVDTKEIKKK
jgi:hypothetical protein